MKERKKVRRIMLNRVRVFLRPYKPTAFDFVWSRRLRASTTAPLVQEEDEEIV